MCKICDHEFSCESRKVNQIFLLKSCVVCAWSVSLCTWVITVRLMRKLCSDIWGCEMFVLFISSCTLWRIRPGRTRTCTSRRMEGTRLKSRLGWISCYLATWCSIRVKIQFNMTTSWRTAPWMGCGVQTLFFCVFLVRAARRIYVCKVVVPPLPATWLHCLGPHYLCTCVRTVQPGHFLHPYFGKLCWCSPCH